MILTVVFFARTGQRDENFHRCVCCIGTGKMLCAVIGNGAGTGASDETIKTEFPASTARTVANTDGHDETRWILAYVQCNRAIFESTETAARVRTNDIAVDCSKLKHQEDHPGYLNKHRSCCGTVV